MIFSIIDAATLVPGKAAAYLRNNEVVYGEIKLRMKLGDE